VAIPDVVGMTSERATYELQSAGFGVVVIHGTIGDRIYRQSQFGMAAPGTAITIWCS
jgi:PASTA domain